MTLEELRIQLGIDHASLANGMRKAVASVQHFGDAFKETVHKAKRQWHQMLHEIGQESPLLASGLKLMMNPIVGTMAFAVSAFSEMSEAIKELGRVMRVVGDGINKPIKTTTEQILKMHEALTSFRDDFDKWMKGTVHKDSIAEQLEKRLEILRENNKEFEKNPKVMRKQLETEFSLYSAALNQTKGETPGLKSNVDHLKQLVEEGLANGRTERAQSLNTAEAKIQKGLEAEKEHLQNLSDEGNIVLGFEQKMEDLNKQIAASEERVAKNNKVISEETIERKRNMDAFNEAQKKYAANVNEVRDLEKGKEMARRNLLFGPGATEDLRDYGQIAIDAVDEKNAAVQKRISDRMIGYEDLFFNILHPNARRNRLANREVPQTMEDATKSMDTTLKDIKTKLDAGIKIFIPDDH
jgi:hypothetical protein